MGNKLLAEIDKAAQDIRNEIGKMHSLGILPFEDGIEKATVQSLTASVDEMVGKTLTIAVCGAVKAGKSTFLNALLFGRDVLPVCPTPCTAKLTFITHTDGNESFTAHFFTQEEYKKMKSSLAADAQQLLEKAERKSCDAGVSPMQLWGTSADGALNDINDYAADGGKFVPFVKDISIHINRPEIKNLYIVDTPGLDDPNPLNSLETERWAAKAHAVIYLVPWRGMGKTDKDFIEKNFGSLENARSNRLFVITQIDDNEDWIHTLDDFKKRFPEEKGNVCGYSALVDLIRSCKTRGEATPDEEAKLEELGRDFNHDPSNVRELVSKRLYNGGVAVLKDALRNVIDRIYCRYIAKAEADVKECELSLKNCELERDEAEKAAKKLGDLRRRIDREADGYTKQALNMLVNGELDSVGSALADATSRIRAKVGATIKTCRNDGVILGAVAEAKSAAESVMREVATELFERKINDSQDAADHVLRKLENVMFEAGCQDYIAVPDLVSISEEGRRLLAKIVLEIDFDSVDDSIHWYNKTSTNVSAVASQFQTFADEACKKLEGLLDSFMVFCRKTLTDFVVKTKTNVQKHLDEVNAAARNAPDEKKKLVQSAQKALADARQRLATGRGASAERTI